MDGIDDVTTFVVILAADIDQRRILGVEWLAKNPAVAFSHSVRSQYDPVFDLPRHTRCLACSQFADQVGMAVQEAG